MVVLINSTHFQQFEDLKISIFFWGSMPPDPPKTLAERPAILI